MKKALLLLTIVCLPLFVFAQTAEKQYYIYNIISFSGSIDSEGLSVDIDDGKKVKTLKDSKGNTIRFRTPAAVIMYMNSLGWELSEKGEYVKSEIILPKFYWIMRKPCTKEEFDKAVKEGIKKPSSDE